MSSGAGTYPAIDPMLTPALNEVLSSLVPLRYKWSESVSYAGYVPAPFSQIQNPVDIKFGFPYNGMEYENGGMGYEMSVLQP